MKKIRVAHYKRKPGKIWDFCIRLWTLSKYSHSEIVFENNNWFSASPRENVRFKNIFIHWDHWDFTEFAVTDEQYDEALKFAYVQQGKEYDWAGIVFSQFIPLSRHSRSRWFCSEVCAQITNIMGITDISDPETISPGRLYKILKEIK